MKCRIDNDKAVLLKEDLENRRDHYRMLMDKHRSQLRRLFYAGKVDLLTDILKQFETEE